MTYDNVLAQAKHLTPRNEAGGWDEAKLLDTVVSLLAFDTDKEKRLKAKRIIDHAAKPGGTDPDGQLSLPGFDKYDYEPNRLIRDDHDHIIEASRALPEFKACDSRRARINAERAQRWANRKTTETDLFQKWALEQATKGRPMRELEWGICIKELGLWTPGNDPGA
jgi:hypothetical protein